MSRKSGIHFPRVSNNNLTHITLSLQGGPDRAAFFAAERRVIDSVKSGQVKSQQNFLWNFK